MLLSLPIPKKIGLAFALVLLSVLAMIAVLWWALARIEGTTVANGRSQEIYAASLEMEGGVQRENSQMRGFLITGDEDYLKQYYESREAETQAAAALNTLLIEDPKARAEVAASHARMESWRRAVGDPIIERSRTDRDGAQDWLRGHSAQVRVTAILQPLRDLRTRTIEAMKATRETRKAAVVASKWSLGIGGLAVMGIALAMSILLSRILGRPIVNLTGVMDQLARGRNDVTVPDAERGDVLGSMSRAVVVFRDTAVDKAQADAEQQQVVDRIGDALGQLANSDLTPKLSGFPASYAAIERDFNAAVSRLAAALASVRVNATVIAICAVEMNQAADDLARRAEQQAASIEETSAAMSEIAQSVTAAANKAQSAESIVRKATGDVAKSEEVVRRTVSAIGDIERSSNEIAEIIAVIAAAITISLTAAYGGRMFTGWFSPTRIGPTVAWAAEHCAIFWAMLALSRDGKIKTLALSVSRLNGNKLRDSAGISAMSAWISPSTSSSGLQVRTSSVAILTFSATARGLSLTLCSQNCSTLHPSDLSREATRLLLRLLLAILSRQNPVLVPGSL